MHKFRDQLTKIEEQQKRENELISDEVAKCQVMLKNESRVRITASPSLSQEATKVTKLTLFHSKCYYLNTHASVSQYSFQ